MRKRARFRIMEEVEVAPAVVGEGARAWAAFLVGAYRRKSAATGGGSLHPVAVKGPVRM